jgi:CubicO group peptidase (beta-lactamase class C family)
MKLPTRHSLAWWTLLWPLFLLGCAQAPFYPAMAPVVVADLKPVLDADMARALKSGPLAPQTHGGVTIGVLQPSVRRIFSYGTAQPDSVFEIGSITKTFTGLILAQMVEQGKVQLDEPVRDLLPPRHRRQARLRRRGHTARHQRSARRVSPVAG